MSERPADGAQRSWLLYVDDMLRFAGKVLSYTEGLDLASFESNSLVHDATARNLERLGEAATHVPGDIRAAVAAGIPWRLVVAARSRRIHGHFGLHNDTLWSVIRNDSPALMADLRRLRERAP